MAGDWIKFEVATLDKPEVRQMARVLGVKHGEALELLLRFWAWIDANSVDGHVDGLVDSDVDELMRCPGFSGVMQMIGWLKCDNAAQRIEIPNADRHTTKSAKKRALSSERQRNWRAAVDVVVDADVDANSVTKPSTREEKRRNTYIAPLPEWVPVDAWNDWKRYKGRKLTPAAVKLQLAKLQELKAAGQSPQAVISQAIEAGWATFYPLRDAPAKPAVKSDGSLQVAL